MRQITKRGSSSPTSPYPGMQGKQGPAVGKGEENQGSSRPNPSEKPALPKVTPLRIDLITEKFDARLRVAQRADGDRLVRRNALPRIARMSKRALTHTMANMRQGMSAQEHQRTDWIIDTAESIIQDSDIVESDHDSVEVTSAGSEEDLSVDTLADNAELEADIKYLRECMNAVAAEHPGDSPEAQQQRRCALIDLLGAVFRNEFKSDAGRRLANFINVGLRTGIAVTLCKFMCDAIAFEVGRASKLDDPLLNIAAILAIAIAPTFNLMGGIASGVLGTANKTSIIARSSLGMMNLAVILACYMTGSLTELGVTLWPYVCYAFARDTCNFWFPLRDNLSSLPFRGVARAGVPYALLQWLGGMGMDVAAPLSGGHGLPRAVGNETVPPELLLAAKLDLNDSALQAVIIGILEIGDDWTVTSIVKSMENEEYLLKAKTHLQDEAVHKKDMKKLSEFAKELLKTPVTERQHLINQMNKALYAREVERMEEQENDGPDGAQKQYLEDLRKMHLCFSGSADIAQMPELREFEHRLGIYKKTRELQRLEQLDLLQLEATQRLYLNALREDVAECRERLDELKKKKEGSPVGPDGKKNFGEEEQRLLDSLQHEFDEVELPPLSLLQPNAHKAPDFTTFDRKVRRECRRLYPKMKPEERRKLVEELFVHEFVSAYLPRRLTPVEHEVMAKIRKDNPQILPSETRDKWLDEVDKHRQKATEGPRIQLGFLPSLTTNGFDFAVSAGRAVFITDAARQNALAVVVGSLVAMNNVMQEGDDNTQLVLGNLLAGVAIYLIYSALYLMHVEGASSGRRVERPGAQGGFPRVREEPETLDDVITPRGDKDKDKREDGRQISEAQSGEASSVLHYGKDDADIELDDPYSARRRSQVQAME